MYKTVKEQLEQQITSRLLLEASPFISMLITVPSVLILVSFPKPAAVFQEYSMLSGIATSGVLLMCCFIGWIINVIWLYKGRKEIQQLVENVYDEKLVKLYTLTSILYVCILPIPLAIILRVSIRSIVKDKVKPNTMSAFLNEKYLNGRGLK
ncbi:hypothetical protein HCJ71_08915 [Listeria sp. FSL L7-0478]|uniref:hypothetical protein n=1 Tax=Listeria cossartiae TaxID=2838249 RepID=UPI001625D6D0|nr:hypothetical protein [Listeria cossartiae]MBC1987394.1 hypothetical protein [Listeria cossartiae subsp. cossartiae]